jgi:hypothetical protein
MGRRMVKVPKFYKKTWHDFGGTYDGKEAWWISDVAHSGFDIEPAFRSVEADIDQFYAGNTRRVPTARN